MVAFVRQKRGLEVWRYHKIQKTRSGFEHDDDQRRVATWVMHMVEDSTKERHSGRSEGCRACAERGFYQGTDNDADEYHIFMEENLLALDSRQRNCQRLFLEKSWISIIGSTEGVHVLSPTWDHNPYQKRLTAQDGVVSQASTRATSCNLR